MANNSLFTFVSFKTKNINLSSSAHFYSHFLSGSLIFPRKSGGSDPWKAWSSAIDLRNVGRYSLLGYPLQVLSNPVYSDFSHKDTEPNFSMII